MAIGIAEEHEELRQTLRRWLESRCPPEVPRALLDAEVETMPPFWAELAEQGWLGIHLPEEFGGQGFGLLELAVVVEEMGRAMAPGPFLATVLASAIVVGSAGTGSAKVLLPGLADGSTPAAVCFPIGLPGGGATVGTGVSFHADIQGDGSLLVSGSAQPVLGATLASMLLAPVRVGSDGGPADGGPADGLRWCAIDLGGAGAGVAVESMPSLDLTRRSGVVTLDQAVVTPERILSDTTLVRVRDLALLVFAAEAAGGARWCLDTAVEHAKTREQFGRPIGQFQGVKHKLADVLVVVEQMAATCWDAAQALGDNRDPAHALAGDPDTAQAPVDIEGRVSALVAGAIALDGYADAAKDCVQVLGGMGFTWEHDAHLHLRRSVTLRQLAGGTAPLRAEITQLALGGHRRRLSVELPPEADAIRAELGPVVDALAALAGDPVAQRRRMADDGLLAPHWPAPWGRGAGAVEQLVIDELCQAKGVRRPSLVIGAWALPTIIAHGTPEQQERWVRPSLRGELIWCQLFSEPGAGSDLASLSTRATRVDGGWSLNGQKVWTSVAARADVGICLARTDPDVPKHEGITYFLVDMKAPGLEVRPLREITGQSLFNEVFFTDVFVPDDCVVGKVNGGWKLARTTLANERVSLAGDSVLGGGLESLLSWLAEHPGAQSPVAVDHVGELLAEAQSLAILGQRVTLRSLGGLQPGPESSVRKLLGAESDQRVQELGLDFLGPTGAVTQGAAQAWAYGFLHTRCLTIAGGTSEVQRNVIGERLLGLPRDPEPGA